MNKLTLLCLPFLFFSLCLKGQSTKEDILKRELSRLEGISNGTIGVGLIDLESGQEIMYNKDQSFPMASTYKIPIAVKLLQDVEAGNMRLDSMITITDKDIHPGSGTISRLLNDPGVSLSVLNLLELMMLISDNSATDLCLELAGGPLGVNQMLEKNGIADLSVDRPTLALIANYIGIDLAADKKLSLSEFSAASEKVDEEQMTESMNNFDQDLRDQSTPYAMAKLLQKIWKGELLNEENTDLLLDIMYRCETGGNRLKGVLPPRTKVAHKTGTIGGTTNDVGIINLPEGDGHIVVVVFVKNPGNSEVARGQHERAIAHIARTAYDYFLFN